MFLILSFLFFSFFLEWKDKSTAFLFEGLSEAQKLIRFVQEEAEGLDISIPEIHLRVPTVITDFLSSINGSESEKSSTNHVLSSSTEENSKNQEKSSNDNNKYQNENGGNQGNNSAAVAAAATAVVLTASDEDSEQSKTKRQKQNSQSISTDDQQLMVLTKKLIEIRSILLSIDHNETLKLPSIVVVGSQSSGKSSVLEAIVGHEFLPK